MATGPNEHPACAYEGACSNTALAQGQEERAKPKSQKALPTFLSLGSISPAASGGHWVGVTQGLEVRWRGLTSDLSHIHTARGQKQPQWALCGSHGVFTFKT